MSDRLTRIVAVLALAIALIAVGVALHALQVAEDRTRDLEQLHDALERAATAATSSGGRPPLRLDRGEDL